ncbi:TetR/AcrR family transcriptional regulator [Sphingomonas sp. ERG5]|uniref:TetR/AcrR family transcriptional regulator n=1 Tax=Sphingomonas sp. ERG5 TaxID=1381597 RepID=UPI0009DF0A19|nr:TetR/AcrR family transcriptional regulator [Sphingomonas sp. ERG5]
MSTLETAAPKKAYHHGDLRAALIDAGLTLLETRTADDLSLREVARAVGVSATAVYRHFPDKGALMAALAADGLARLAVVQHAASDAAGGGVAGFGATGAAYVRFALANPALFRLIFANPASIQLQPKSHEDDAMAFLRANAALLAKGKGGDAQVIALQAWAIAHGLAMLMLDGQVPVDDTLIDRVIVTDAIQG